MRGLISHHTGAGRPRAWYGGAGGRGLSRASPVADGESTRAIMLGRMQAALLWLLLSVCIQDAASVAELGYWVCSGLCDDGTRILLTNEPGDYKGVRTSESECSMAVATSYALTQCGTGVTKIKNIFSHGPFENSEAGRAAARDFSENVLDATTKYYKNIGVQVGPTTANIPAECVTGTRRVTEEISVAVSKVVGEATCSCHDFVKAAILVCR
jgi:hypothetical protein